MKLLEMQFCSVVLCVALSACGGGSNDCLICRIPPNQPPTAQTVTLNLSPGQTIRGVVRAVDPEDDPITFSIESLPARGDLQITAGGSYTYTAPGAFTSSELFVIHLRDGNGNVGEAAFNVRVSGAVESGTCAIDVALLGATPNHITTHPRDPSRIAILTRDGGNYTAVHTSRDGGVTWLHSDAMREQDVVTLAFHPTLRGTLFAAVSGVNQPGIKRTDNQGTTWQTRLGVDDARDVHITWANPGYIRTRIWAATSNGLYFSEDNGQVWERSEAWRDFFSVSTQRGNPSVAFASTASGLVKRMDHSIQEIDGEGAYSKVTFTLEGVYAASDYSLSRTTIDTHNFGNTTHLLGSGAGAPVVLADFAVHPNESEMLYVIESGRLMASTDVGDSWSYVEAAESLGPLSTVSVSNEGTVYVGTFDGVACLQP